MFLILRPTECSSVGILILAEVMNNIFLFNDHSRAYKLVHSAIAFSVGTVSLGFESLHMKIPKLVYFANGWCRSLCGGEG